MYLPLPARTCLQKAYFKEDGQSIIEMALVLPMMILLVFGLFEFSMLLYTYSVMYEAAHQGIRYAEVHGSDTGVIASGCSTSSPAGVISTVQNAASASLHDTSAMTVTVCYPDTTGSTPLSLVTVTVGYKYVPYVNVTGVTPTMSITSEGRIVY
ncbi:MAG TPA: TadE/TadG family type IV pilus assembly protein [Edaphobacter sp.]|nr:TadE/TadG family type IV pilus assembly protein [Edaphobacter sp.]